MFLVSVCIIAKLCKLVLTSLYKIWYIDGLPKGEHRYALHKMIF